MPRHASILGSITFAALICLAGGFVGPSQWDIPAEAGIVEEQNARPAGEAELEKLCRALRASGSAADIAQLTSFAQRQADTDLGPHAALALGYHYYTKKRYKDARPWFARAERDTLLREYALYWGALTDRALGEQRSAFAKFQTIRREFPESVLSEDVVQGLAETGLASGQAGYVVELLDAYPKAASKPALMLLWARALEKAKDHKARSAQAAKLYRDIYFRFPLSDQAKDAGKKLPLAERDQPGPLLLERANKFYDVGRCRDARKEYQKLVRGKRLPPEFEQAAVRLEVCRVELGGSPKKLAALTTPEADAERFFELSQVYRGKGQEGPMLDAIEQVVGRYPKSRWSEEALFAAGNYFWVTLDRKRASDYYRRVMAQFPSRAYARLAQWRIAWTAYMERDPQAAPLFEEYLRRYPDTPQTENALYWLGRSAERAGNASLARSFYLKLINRFPETYFGMEAGKRMAALGAGPTNDSEILALVPAAEDPPELAGPIPAKAARRWERAQALRTIGFDASAELELRAAYAETRSRRMLIEAGRAAFDAGNYASAFSAGRQAYPDLESRRLQDGPQEIWRLVYPYAYGGEIEQASALAGVDPMLVAGLIRQESVFQRDAISKAGAIGLMQVLPKTGRGLSRRLKLRYSKARLTQAEYNLRLGTTHLADLLRQFGREGALAAYNAGDSRVAAWQAGRTYEEPAEFVECIPFTETREYVQIVTRNAEVYRRLYGKKQ